MIASPQMFINYQSLPHAFKKLGTEWDNLYQSSGNDYDMIHLVLRQLIGAEMKLERGDGILSRYDDDANSLWSRITVDGFVRQFEHTFNLGGSRNNKLNCDYMAQSLISNITALIAQLKNMDPAHSQPSYKSCKII